MDWQAVDGSFRDPSGFVYTRNGILYRQVNRVFREPFEAFLSSGLHDELIQAGLLVADQPAALELAATDQAFAVLQPERVEFVSYPYEWCFGQLQDAALLTLELQERALARGFELRDASAYNVQFQGGRPIFIDSLSFAPRQPGKPWVAYRQFCEHFLVPLALMSLKDVRCGGFQRGSLEGIPLEVGSRLLPFRTWTRPSALLHIHLHARLQSRYASKSVAGTASKRSMSPQAVLGLVKSLRAIVTGLNWEPAGTEWADYAHDHNYSTAAARSKRETVSDLLRQVQRRVVWDLGANTGEYSRVAREAGARVIAFDLDPAAVERNYRQVKRESEKGILPLLQDLSNPSPGQGWAGTERMSLEQRGPADVALALALVHHLAIGRNLPLVRLAEFLARLARSLIIEFVPKADSQVQRLLRNREDVFPGYTQEAFEDAFRRHFTIDAARPVAESERTLYLMSSCGPRG
jgi:SAM-dependent methyltransferase